jgi:aspartate oxidase
MDPERADRYEQIRQVLRTLGIRSGEAQIEVFPAQHSLMGGVRIDENAQSDLPGLFAVGEVSGGAHGAHRLAACGGTEVVAMGAIAGESAADRARRSRRGANARPILKRPELLPLKPDALEQAGLRRIRQALDAGCGILRTREGLRDTVAELDGILAPLRNEGKTRTFLGRSGLLALAIAQSAFLREESRGDHYRTDHPARNDISWFGNLAVRLLADEQPLDFSYEKAGLASRSTVSLLPSEPQKKENPVRNQTASDISYTHE